MLNRLRRLALALFFVMMTHPVWAGEARVAVAANFQGVIGPLGEAFTQIIGHKIVTIPGATGKLYAQISQDAPLDVFLSADAATPQKLEAEGLAVPGSGFVYALGRLELVGRTPESWETKPESQNGCLAWLKGGNYKRLALANPQLAPYGKAAEEVMNVLNLPPSPWRWVQTESITQALQMVMAGNVDLAFVAASQVLKTPADQLGCRWPVPVGMHAPLAQEAILLKRAQNNAAARAFLVFLQSKKAREIISQNGYGLP